MSYLLKKCLVKQIEYKLKDQNIMETLHNWKNVCQRVPRDQPKPGSLFEREAEKRDPGNEVGFIQTTSNVSRLANQKCREKDLTTSMMSLASKQAFKTNEF